MPTASAHCASMANEHASRVASIVASYLRKHGFSKTLSAFLREHGDAIQETDIVDLEVLCNVYFSTQANEVSKAKKSKRTKSDNGPSISKGDKDFEDDVAKASLSLHMNRVTSSEKKENVGKKSASDDLPELDQTDKCVAEAKKFTREKSSKKKKGGVTPEGNDTKTEDLMSEREKSSVSHGEILKHNGKEASSNGNAVHGDSALEVNDTETQNVGGGCLATQQENVHSRKSSSKKSKEERKEQGGVTLQENETLILTEIKPAENVQALSQVVDMPKKKGKKLKVSGSVEVSVPDDLPELDQTSQCAAAAKNFTKEEISKKKKGPVSPEGDGTRIEVLMSECEKSLMNIGGIPKHSVKEASSNGNAAHVDSALGENDAENHNVGDDCLMTEQEIALSRKSSSKKRKKERNVQEGVSLQENETLVPPTEVRPAGNAQVLSQGADVPEKKRKKSKDSGCMEKTIDPKEVIPALDLSQNSDLPKKKRKKSKDPDYKEEKIEDGAAVISVSKVSSHKHMEKVDVSNQPGGALEQSIESPNNLKGDETSAKKKKRTKELSSHGVEDGLKGLSDSHLEENKSNYTDGKKKKQLKGDASVGKNSIQDPNNSRSHPEKSIDVDATADKDVIINELESAKIQNKKGIPNDKKTPSGALAFKRVEVGKVEFLDPRLTDNSYWAKDGSEVGYGAKAQEVLGLVRGKDFRHEKTKKKRGSYRGGLIGLESHSIKFANSDEE